MIISNKDYRKKWEERYSQSQYAYGTSANVFFREQLERFAVGSLLLPAEGEGRNAVYAATKGWKVTAFDLSENAKQKAENLAKNHGVSIDYQVGSLEDLEFEEASFDVIGLIYAHFLADKKDLYHRQLCRYLKTGGVVILEAFGKNHLPLMQENPKVGGPKDVDLLFSTQEIRASFENFDIEILEETQVLLNEGLYHNGKGSVVRFVGRKR